MIRRALIRPFVLALVLCVAAPVSAGELVIQASGLQRAVEKHLFKEQGRWYLRRDNACHYAYLEKPRLRIAAGRIFIDAFLSAQQGALIQGACFGPLVESNITASALPSANGSVFGLKNLAIERIEDPVTAALFDFAKEARLVKLPQTVSIDLKTEIQHGLASVQDISLNLATLQLQQPIVAGDQVRMKFDFLLTAQ